MNMILQITETPSELSIAALLMKGGIVMVPIVLLSLATFYLLIERYLYIRSATKGRKDLMSHITRFLHHGDINPPSFMPTRIPRYWKNHSERTGTRWQADQGN